MRTLLKVTNGETDMECFIKLPIWEAHSDNISGHESSNLLSADQAIAIKDDGLLLPWMSAMPICIRADSVRENYTLLKSLQCSTPSQAQVYKSYLRNNFPDSLPSNTEWKYIRFIRLLVSEPQLQRWGIDESHKLAVNGRRHFVTASTLYDHTEQVFVAAFRCESEERFLLPDLQSCGYELWCQLKLHKRDAHHGLSPDDYLACLDAIDRRVRKQSHVNDPHLMDDANHVLGYLRYFSPGLQRFTKTHCTSLASYQIFPVCKSFQNQPSYRRRIMEVMIRTQNFTSLSSGLHQNNLRISWSQKPLINNAISPEFLDILSIDTDVPNCVIPHLRCLRDIVDEVPFAEADDYLTDIRSVYQYLQGFTQQPMSVRSLEVLKSEKVWFNVDWENDEHVWTSGMKQYWTSLDRLCLRMPYDSSSVKYVRSSLLTFEKLLRSSGCLAVEIPSSVSYPTIANTTPLSESLLSLWDEGVLVDVKFQCSDNIIIDAHKVVLATKSEYFRRQFSEKWDPRTDEPVKLEDVSGATLGMILDYVYQRKTTCVQGTLTTEDEIADSLDEVLALLKASGRFLIRDLFEKTEKSILDRSSLFIRVDNVRSILSLADEIDAKHLKSYCQEYLKKNRRIIDSIVE